MLDLKLLRRLGFQAPIILKGVITPSVIAGMNSDVITKLV